MVSGEGAQVRKTALGREIRRDRVQRPAIMFCAGKLQCEKCWAGKFETQVIVFILILTSYVVVGKSHHSSL